MPVIDSTSAPSTALAAAGQPGPAPCGTTGTCGRGDPHGRDNLVVLARPYHRHRVPGRAQVGLVAPVDDQQVGIGEHAAGRWRRRQLVDHSSPRAGKGTSDAPVQGGVVTMEPPASPRPRRRARTRTGAGCNWRVISFITASALAVLYVVGGNIGVEALVIGLIAAIIPVPVLVLIFLWLDRYEPEPVAYLVFCFTWGASRRHRGGVGRQLRRLGALRTRRAPAGVGRGGGGPGHRGDRQGGRSVAVAVAAPPAASGITDGIVYCGLSATGFAMVENILYLGGTVTGPAGGVRPGHRAAGAAGHLHRPDPHVRVRPPPVHLRGPGRHRSRRALVVARAGSGWRRSGRCSSRCCSTRPGT